MAKTIKFYLDQKVTVWNRTSFEITAETEEEAREIAKQFINRGGENEVAETDDERVDFIETETLYDTEEPMSVEENGNQPTLELYVESVSPDSMIANNANI